MERCRVLTEQCDLLIYLPRSYVVARVWHMSVSVQCEREGILEALSPRPFRLICNKWPCRVRYRGHNAALMLFSSAEVC